MSKINAFSRVLNRKGKTRFFMDFQLVDSLNMTAFPGRSRSQSTVPVDIDHIRLSQCTRS